MRGKINTSLLILAMVVLNTTLFAQRTPQQTISRSGSSVSQTVNANFVPTSNTNLTSQTAPGNPYPRVMTGLKDMKLQEMGPGSQSAVCSRYFDNCDKLYNNKTKTFSDPKCQGYIDDCIKFIGITPKSCTERFDMCLSQVCNPKEVCADFNEAQTIAGECLTGLQSYYKYACSNRQFSASLKKFSTLASQQLAAASLQKEAQLAQNQVSQLQAQLERQKQEAQTAIQQAKQEAVSELSSPSSSGTNYAQSDEPEFFASEEFDKCYEKLNRAQNLLQLLQNYTDCTVEGDDPRDRLAIDGANWGGLDLLGGVSSIDYGESCAKLPLRLKATSKKVREYTKAMDEYKSCVTTTLKTSKKAAALDESEMKKLTKLLTFLRTGSVNTISDRLNVNNFVKSTSINVYENNETSSVAKRYGDSGEAGAKSALGDAMKSAQTLYNIADFVNEEFAKVVGGDNINIQIAEGYQVTRVDCTQYFGNPMALAECRKQEAISLLSEINNNPNNKSLKSRNMQALKSIGTGHAACQNITESTIDTCVNAITGGSVNTSGSCPNSSLKGEGRTLNGGQLSEGGTLYKCTNGIWLPSDGPGGQPQQSTPSTSGGATPPV